MSDQFHIIIPARMNSSRLDKKVLADIQGKTMLEHVYCRAQLSNPETITIATDHVEIAEVAENFGAQVCMTSSAHQSGTERISEAIDALNLEDEDVVINLQADEPLISPFRIKKLAGDLLMHESIKVSTLAEPIQNENEMNNPNVVKVILNKRQYAMYFSRSAIPHCIDQEKNVEFLHCYRHIGLYGYRVSYLKQYLDLSPSPLAEIESLEQLRILWNGGRIHVVVVETDKSNPGVSVDTQADLDFVRDYLKKNPVTY